MPTIKPVSELQRNTAAIVKEAMETKEPIYLTKNGTSSVVILDARTYDNLIKRYHRMHDEYVRTSVELGRLQNDVGMSYTLDQVEQHLREEWGEDAF